MAVRASKQEQTGGAGLNEVAGAFERIGWGPAVNQPHDLGTDLWLQVRDARQVNLGMMVGAQVKAGPSWFARPAHDEAGELQGWWFRADREHFSYWLGHSIPHLVVLYDLDDRVAYWVHVTSETVVSTGVQSKILVPKANIVDAHHLDELIVVAATGLAGVPWEGSIWMAGAAIPVAEHLRHALIVPRLIAPHPNAGHVQPITAEQAVAMLMQARLRDLGRLAEAFPEVPKMGDAGGSACWGWRFAGALYARVTTSDISLLVRCVDDAHTPSERAAAAAVAASAFSELGQADTAIELLTPIIESDSCGPVDHNWLLIQRARARAEIGEVELAHQDAIATQATRALAPNDATAGAISAAAAALLFNTSPTPDIEQVITNTDTAAGWWRAQVSSRALGAAVERWFGQWADDRTVTRGGEHTAHNQLAAAEMTASHTGDQGGWRHLAALGAIDQLVGITRDADPAEAASALSNLRLAGDDKALVRAVDHIVKDGPVRAVTLAGSDIDLGQSTRTTGLANLKFLRHGADVLDLATATAAAGWILASLGNSVNFAQRTQPTYLVDLELIETLAALLGAANSQIQRQVADVVLHLPAQENQVLATAWARLADAVPDVTWTKDDATYLATGAGQHHFPLDSVLRGVSARLGDTGARAQLIEEVAAGSLQALRAIGDVSQLDSAVAKAQISSLATSVRRVISNAHQGSYGIGSDVCRPLALLNIWHPSVADWAAVADLLGDDAVAVDDKRLTLELLADTVERIPEDVRERLAQAVSRIARGEGSVVPSIFGPARDAAAEAALLAMALGAFEAEEAAAQVVRLLDGQAEDRYWAAVIASRDDSPLYRGFLISLSTDHDADVRAAACNGLARSTSNGLDPLIVAALRRCAEDPGRAVAMHLAHGLRWLRSTDDDKTHALADEIAKEIAEHPSARARELAVS
jgi:hypothetical protein